MVLSPEICQRAVHIVFEVHPEHCPSRWQFGPRLLKIGCTTQTLCNLGRLHEPDIGQRAAFVESLGPYFFYRKSCTDRPSCFRMLRPRSGLTRRSDLMAIALDCSPSSFPSI